MTYNIDLQTVKGIPGPGAYEPKTSLNKNGLYVVSNLKSAVAPSFTQPKLGPHDGREIDHIKFFKYVPGPGSYTPKLNIGEKTSTSTYRQTVAKSFYHHDRFPNSTVSQKCKYQQPSNHSDQDPDLVYRGLIESVFI